MQQHDGLAIIYYPATISRKRLHFQTWSTQYHLKRRHSFLDESMNAQPPNTNNHQSCPINQSNATSNTHLTVNSPLNVITPRSSNNHLSAPMILSRPPSSHGERLVAGKDGFSKVPHEIMMNILEYLEPTEIISLSMVNRKLRSHTQDNYLWQQILLKEYGEDAIQEEPRQVNTKGKWKKSKSARKQISIVPNWKRVFMRLSTVNVSTKTAIFKGQPGTFYKYRNFDHKDNVIRDTSNHNQIRQKQRSYKIEMTISNVPPGVYDIIWRMRIERSSYKPVVVFNTDIWLRHNIYLSSYERESKFYYAPNPDDFSHVIDKGWFNFRLPFKVIISRKEQSDDYRYQVHTGINCNLGNEQYNGKNSGMTKNRGPFSVDSVCLRPHIAYDQIRAPSSIFEENYLSPDSLSADIDSDNPIPESVYSDNEYSEYDTQTSVDGDVRSYVDRVSSDNERRWSRESGGKKEYIKKVFLCAGSNAYVE